MEKEITIVIPARNEETSIARCIESIFAALEGFNNFEIILVDSYSSDRTVEIAKKYSIRILRLQKHWPRSPHAGRYLGAINSNSKYIFYLDADMAVHRDWIKIGLSTLEKDTNLAGVTGVLYNVFPGNKPEKGRPLNKNIGYVDFLPGAAIFRSDVLKRIEHFNPFFVGYGEKEAGYRISKTGFKQLKLNEIIAYHFVKKPNLEEAKEKSGYFIGVGQFLRLHFNFNNLFVIFKQYPHLVIFYCYFLSLCILSFYSIIQKKVIFVSTFISLGIIILLALIGKQRNLKKTGLFIFSIFSSSINFIRGLIRKPVTSKEYPTDVEVVK
jgi:glycosyltransferase involved in cell wall biosynthesis